MKLKEGFNASLQHAFFDQEKEFYFDKICLFYPTKFGRHLERKIIFSSPSTAPKSTSCLETPEVHFIESIHTLCKFSSPRNNFAVDDWKKVLLEFSHFTSTLLSLNSFAPKFRVFKLYCNVSFASMPIHSYFISTLNLLHLL